MIFIQQNLAHALLFQGRYDEALAIYRQNFEGAAQGGGASGALKKVVGKFAMTVASGTASRVLAGEVERTIHPEQQEKTEPKVSGYTFTLVWQSHDGIYSGKLRMQRVTGTFRVRAPNGIIFDQDMEASYVNGDVLLVGSNPRYAGSSEPAYEYSPDIFRLTQLPTGEWTIVDTIDTQGQGAQVRVVEAATF